MLPYAWRSNHENYFKTLLWAAAHPTWLVVSRAGGGKHNTYSCLEPSARRRLARFHLWAGWRDYCHDRGDSPTGTLNTRIPVYFAFVLGAYVLSGRIPNPALNQVSRTAQSNTGNSLILTRHLIAFRYSRHHSAFNLHHSRTTV